MGARLYRPTSEVLALCDVDMSMVRTWRRRGDLKLAPRGRHGQGRGNELLWSPEAVAELEAHVALRRTETHSDVCRRKKMKCS